MVVCAAQKVLGDSDKKFYAENGYLLIRNTVSDAWLARLRNAVREVGETHREQICSTRRVGVHATHSRAKPALEWVSNPDIDSEAIWTFASAPEILNLVAGLLGDDICFHHSLLVFNRLGARSYDWHQDAAYRPDPNATSVLISVHLADYGPLDARNAVIPGSHKGPLFSHADEHGAFVGLISKDDLQKVDTTSKIELTRTAGAVEFLHPLTIHQDDVGCQCDGGAILRFAYISGSPHAKFEGGSHRYGTNVRGRSTEATT
ncbi:MAG: phytanoyl-CoA dioxygenase family protein [Alphaproteobacteria bacterium]